MVGIVVSSGAFVVTVAKDREDKLRYLLNFAGQRPVAYYLGLFLGDFLLYVIPIFFLVIISYILDIKEFYNNSQRILVSLIIFGFPLISMAHIVSFLFSKAGSAFKYAFMAIGIMSGVPFALLSISPNAMYIIQLIDPLVSLSVSMKSIMRDDIDDQRVCPPPGAPGYYEGCKASDHIV